MPWEKGKPLEQTFPYFNITSAIKDVIKFYGSSITLRYTSLGYVTFLLLSKLNFSGHLMASVYQRHISSLRKALKPYADSKTKEWWEKHMRHVIPFHGVKMGEILTVLHIWVERVFAFVDTHIHHLSREALRYILGKQNATFKKRYVDAHTKATKGD